MKVFNFGKIRFNRLAWWQIGVVAFLLALVVILFLNAFLFYRMREKGCLPDDVEEMVFSKKTVNPEALEAAVSELDSKNNRFNEILQKGVSIADPSL